MIFNCYWVSTVACWPSTFMTVDCFDCRLWTVNCWLSTVEGRLSWLSNVVIVNHRVQWLLRVKFLDCQLSWLLTVGTVDCRLLWLPSVTTVNCRLSCQLPTVGLKRLPMFLNFRFLKILMPFPASLKFISFSLFFWLKFMVFAIFFAGGFRKSFHLLLGSGPGGDDVL